jgi:hypothetical protein
MMERMRKPFASIGLALGLLLLAPPALADDYESQSAGHPLRIAAYVLHPVGVALDWLIFRPAHWIGSKGPMKHIFGHEDATPRISEPKRPSNPPNPDGIRESAESQ